MTASYFLTVVINERSKNFSPMLAVKPPINRGSTTASIFSVEPDGAWPLMDSVTLVSCAG